MVIGRNENGLNILKGQNIFPTSVNQAVWCSPLVVKPHSGLSAAIESDPPNT